jgi:hypothetical protein
MATTDTIIKDNTDPYVNDLESTFTPIAQPIINDGSDPDVNNGTAPEEPIIDPENGTYQQGLTSAEENTRSQATQQDVTNAKQKNDWRVALRLAPGADYIYYNRALAGILSPLYDSNGVIFPYTPTISVSYAASYSPTEAVHSNYKIFQYSSSSVDNITISCDFTAQDTKEANYLLAVIHFFRTITKMFYGKDQYPKAGTPPPLCYLTGLGAFQFDNHPLAITNFTYNLPNNVDYIRATNSTMGSGVNESNLNTPYNVGGLAGVSCTRLGSLQPGAVAAAAQFNTTQPGTKEPTYVPTKIQIQLTAVPMVSRADISDRFSLRDYATGQLLRGSKNNTGGIW